MDKILTADRSPPHPAEHPTHPQARLMVWPQSRQREVRERCYSRLEQSCAQFISQSSFPLPKQDRIRRLQLQLQSVINPLSAQANPAHLKFSCLTDQTIRERLSVATHPPSHPSPCRGQGPGPTSSCSEQQQQEIKESRPRFSTALLLGQI